jgi:hypothetical protein
MAVHARVDLTESLTFGDLYQFVDLARASGVDPSTKGHPSAGTRARA